ncbi:hypothetical protein OXX59_008324 [Metschnikowia pulcherrima]
MSKRKNLTRRKKSIVRAQKQRAESLSEASSGDEPDHGSKIAPKQETGHDTDTEPNTRVEAQPESEADSGTQHDPDSKTTPVSKKKASRAARDVQVKEEPSRQTRSKSKKGKRGLEPDPDSSSKGRKRAKSNETVSRRLRSSDVPIADRSVYRLEDNVCVVLDSSDLSDAAFYESRSNVYVKPEMETEDELLPRVEIEICSQSVSDSVSSAENGSELDNYDNGKEAKNSSSYEPEFNSQEPEDIEGGHEDAVDARVLPEDEPEDELEDEPHDGSENEAHPNEIARKSDFSHDEISDDEPVFKNEPHFPAYPQNGTEHREDNLPEAQLDTSLVDDRIEASHEELESIQQAENHKEADTDSQNGHIGDVIRESRSGENSEASDGDNEDSDVDGTTQNGLFVSDSPESRSRGSIDQEPTRSSPAHSDSDDETLGFEPKRIRDESDNYVKTISTCKKCPMKFEWRRGFPKSILKQMEIHHTGHSSRGRLPCKFCSWTTNRRDFLNKHMDLHGEYLQVKEEYARTLFLANTPSGEKSSDPSLKYTCVECDLAFRRSDHLQSHKLKHSNEKQHKCDECGERFKRVQDLRSHHETGHSRAVDCDKCKLTFKDKSILEVHVRSVHYTHKCRFCHKGFANEQAMKGHISMVHKHDLYTPESDAHTLLTSGDAAERESGGNHVGENERESSTKPIIKQGDGGGGPWLCTRLRHMFS